MVVVSVEMDSSGAFSLKCCSCETQLSLGQGAREAWGYFLLSPGTCIAAVHCSRLAVAVSLVCCCLMRLTCIWSLE